MDNSNQQKQPVYKKSKKLMTKKRLIIGIMVVFILVSGGVGSWIYFSNKKTATDKSTTSLTKNEKLLVETQDDTQKIVNYGGDINKAATIYDNAVNNTDDNQTKYTLYWQKASMYFNAGNYDEAIVNAKLAESITKSATIAEFIAMSYKQKDDTQNAILYYQNAIALVEKSDPSAEAKIKNYQSSIDALEATK